MGLFRARGVILSVLVNCAAARWHAANATVKSVAFTRCRALFDQSRAFPLLRYRPRPANQRRFPLRSSPGPPSGELSGQSVQTHSGMQRRRRLYTPRTLAPPPPPLPHPSPLFNEDSTPKWREPQTKTYLPPFPTSLSLRLLLDTMSTLSGTSWEGKKYRVFGILVSPFRRLSRPRLPHSRLGGVQL